MKEMNLQDARNEIDMVDSELVRLLERRYELVSEVAAYKAQTGMQVYDKNREEQVLNRIGGKVTHENYREYILDTFSAVMEVSRAFQTNYLQNIVLIGMPGCGKSTIGRRFAEKYGYRFIDADEEFAKVYGMTPAECIRQKGEAQFRRMEGAVLEDFRRGTRTVFALGGGVVTVPDNFETVKPLGTVVYIKRPLEQLPISNRPISAMKGIDAIYAERASTYELWADIEIENNESVDAAVEKLAARSTDF